jgi:hypothetical protein
MMDLHITDHGCMDYDYLDDECLHAPESGGSCQQHSHPRVKKTHFKAGFPSRLGLGHKIYPRARERFLGGSMMGI